MRTWAIVLTIVAMAGRVARAEEPSFVLGGDVEAVPLAPEGARFSTTLGTIDGARWLPPERRAPGFALVAAESPAGVTATRIRLVGRGALPTQTSPGARVTVEIAGRTFGPVTADARGHAAVPVEVPPDATVAQVHAVDRFGRKTTRDKALPRSSFPTALLVAPAAMRGGETRTAVLFVIDDAGAWREDGAPEVTTDPALVAASRPRRTAPGRWEIELTTPRTAPTATAAVTVSFDGELLRRDLAVTALPDAPRLPPPPRAPRPPRFAGGQAGLATDLDGLTSALLAAEVAWPVRLRGQVFHLCGGLGGAIGSHTPSATPSARTAELTQVFVELGARMRIALGERAHLDLGAGLGWAWVSATVTNAGDTRTRSDSAPLVYAAALLALRLGPGEAFADVRWIDVRYDPFTVETAGTALGLSPTVGWRAAF